MHELDKAAMGARIRQIRLRAKLRQWELAKKLGTTQSAVHKYEHGVVPEPRRLVELARVGETSIEWILTGSHWENGSDEQNRLTSELLDTACLLRQISDEERASLDEALRIVREAVRVLGGDEGGDQRPDVSTLVASLSRYSVETLKLLEDAWRIQHAVLERVLRDAEGRLRTSPLMGGNGEPS
jgi:transcriptional regulator with XRE-family HTH domain